MIDSESNRDAFAEVIQQQRDGEYRDRRIRRTVFLLLLAIVIFVAVRVTIRPINSLDYSIFSAAVSALWQGQDPYAVRGYVTPPWTPFLLAPLRDQPLETWLALTVTIYVVAVLDRGHPAALLLLLHPIFIVLIASSNPEWILVGTGLWLLELSPRGWGRGVAWLLLATKPQTTWILLLFESAAALRAKDWKAFLVAAVVALITYALTPFPLTMYATRLGDNTWSLPIVFNYGIIGAAVVTVFVLLVRWQRRADYQAFGLIFSLIWTPYALQYAFTTMLYMMRNAGWLRTILYLLAGIVLAGVFWDEYHVQEEIGAAGMLLLAAILAPSNVQPHTHNTIASAAKPNLPVAATDHPIG